MRTHSTWCMGGLLILTAILLSACFKIEFPDPPAKDENAVSFPASSAFRPTENLESVKEYKRFEIPRNNENYLQPISTYGVMTVPNGWAEGIYSTNHQLFYYPNDFQKKYISYINNISVHAGECDYEQATFQAAREDLDSQCALYSQTYPERVLSLSTGYMETDKGYPVITVIIDEVFYNMDEKISTLDRSRATVYRTSRSYFIIGEGKYVYFMEEDYGIEEFSATEVTLQMVNSFEWLE